MFKTPLSLIDGRPRQNGFTLVELSVVLIIITLLAGGILLTVSAQFEQSTRNATELQLQNIQDALLGFATSHAAADGKPYLPCPDTDGDGRENRKNGNTYCESDEGLLPWGDLSVGAQDAWGNRFRYRIDPKYAGTYDAASGTVSTGFGLTTTGTLKVCEQAACTTVLANAVPAVILSHGKNGFGATNAGNTQNAAPAGTDELENTDGDDIFVAHTPTAPGPNEFDDLVTWISPNILYNRLIAAGRLP